MGHTLSYAIKWNINGRKHCWHNNNNLNDYENKMQISVLSAYIWPIRENKYWNNEFSIVSIQISLIIVHFFIISH